MGRPGWATCFRYKPQDLNKPPGIYATLSSHGIELEFVVRVTGLMARYPMCPETEVRYFSNDSGRAQSF